MDEPDIRDWEQPLLRWNIPSSHKCYRASEDSFIAHADSTPMEYFSGVMADMPFKAGKQYYFEILLRHDNTSNDMQVKVGLTTETNMNVPYGFSDKDTGWSYYLWQEGYCRHCSNCEGRNYGEGYKYGQVLGIYVDLIQGTLAFSVDGLYYGICFDGLSLDMTYYFVVGMNNSYQTVELVRKTPAYWERRKLALYAKSFAQTACILNRLKTVHFREAIEFL